MKDFQLEVIKEFNLYVKKVGPGVIYLAELLRKNKFQEAFSSLVDFTEGIQWLNKSYEYLKTEGIKLNIDIEDLNNFLEEINEGLENQDFVLVADILEYEIADFFNNLKEINIDN